MEISFVNKNKAVQPQQVRDSATDPARNVGTEENSKYVLKNKVDSAEISSTHSGNFDDKRITVAKSAILYDVSVNISEERISELKSAIEKGEYDVPANILAEEILK
ncbi:MAG TPA: flagellar biosynthesis anti-sigma factor FlgM [Anaerovoracaceae bacterium]|nr:flagellar biosynthesis anti-sigma factor FlgM [Anaerovoracaceae bacterium]